MTEQQRLRCAVTRYSLDESGHLRAIASPTTTGYNVRNGWLRLHIAAAGAEIDDLLDGAREGRGWLAQAGTPPVRANGRWSGRIWPEIHVSAEALLEVLEERNG